MNGGGLPRLMNHGLWIWPSDPKAQRIVISKVMNSGHLVPAIVAVSKSKNGLSNSQLDEVISDNSNWMTLWVIRQLTSLGFIEYKVDLFGGPATYILSELGRLVLPSLTGQASALAASPAPTH